MLNIIDKKMLIKLKKNEQYIIKIIKKKNTKNRSNTELKMLIKLKKATKNIVIPMPIK
jgi:tRNA A-37 threonylcarbamoyl transferase component Bud32